MSDLVDEAVRHLRLSSSITDSKAQRAVNVVAEEIERLQDAKRRALNIADERSKENVLLRAQVERASEVIQELFPLAQMALDEHSHCADDELIKWTLDVGLMRRACKLSQSFSSTERS